MLSNFDSTYPGVWKHYLGQLQQTGKGRDWKGAKKDALRVITGAKKGTSHTLLYSETRIDKLQDRRDRKKWVQMYKIQTGQCPSIFSELMPRTAGARAEYPLRPHRIDTLVPISTGT